MLEYILDCKSERMNVEIVHRTRDFPGVLFVMYSIHMFIFDDSNVGNATPFAVSVSM